ncbi:MAG: class I SAM-dependent methyltransferase [Moorea sp. SIO2I5]|nr:class I SAM-dependent methyltransferase [Moorena sp. SIO2I5]
MIKTIINKFRLYSSYINMGNGVRELTLDDISPNCQISLQGAYSLKEIVAPGMQVADMGCGYGPLQQVIEGLGAKWIGIEPFTSESHIINASAENLPFEDNFFDVVIMNAVLEHIPDVSKAFTEVSRVLKSGGCLVGYVAFMECFHEISYNHLSHKALEEYSLRNGMNLEIISPGGSFGIDYHCARLIEPFIRFNSPFTRFILRPLLRHIISGQISLMAFKRYWKNKLQLGMDTKKSREDSELYRRVQLLIFANGFEFLIRKK